MCFVCSFFGLILPILCPNALGFYFGFTCVLCWCLPLLIWLDSASYGGSVGIGFLMQFLL